MKLADAELQSRLAAEYVLGTLKGAARRRFAEYLRDPARHDLRASVAAWEAQMTPLAEAVTQIDPPARVWQRIEARIRNESLGRAGDLSTKGLKTPAPAGLFSSLAFWRGLGVGASSFAAVLLATVLSGDVFAPKEAMLTAVLEDQGVARMIVEQPKRDMLMVKMVKPWMAASENSLQLWVLPRDGQPRSIGIVNQDGSTKLSMEALDALLADGAAFALSKEPRGGSPTGLPTGKILCKGVIAKMPTAKTPAKPGQI
jgi:anti-sigma-K factor RskA